MRGVRWISDEQNPEIQSHSGWISVRIAERLDFEGFSKSLRLDHVLFDIRGYNPHDSIFSCLNSICYFLHSPSYTWSFSVLQCWCALSFSFHFISSVIHVMSLLPVLFRRQSLSTLFNSFIATFVLVFGPWFFHSSLSIRSELRKSQKPIIVNLRLELWPDLKRTRTLFQEAVSKYASGFSVLGPSKTIYRVAFFCLPFTSHSFFG